MKEKTEEERRRKEEEGKEVPTGEWSEEMEEGKKEGEKGEGRKS